MTCSDCSHWDEINWYCWVRWIEVSESEAYVYGCSRDDSKEENEGM